MATSRFEPLAFKNGKTARNRVVVPPMASQTADRNGFVTEATLSHYQRLAESNAGLIFVEYTYVHPSGKGEANQLGANSWEQVEGLAKIARAIQQAGSLAGLQIVHVGGKSTADLTGGPLLGASAISVPVKGWQPEKPVRMQESEIEMMAQWYVDAALRAAAAGFDFVELHAAHGYGLNQFLSPVTNQRGDSYGGSVENRGRLLLTIAKRIKQEIPRLLLAVRMPAQDHFPGGLEPKEMIWVAQELEKLGVDLIDVSSGIGGWRRTDNRSHQGYLVEDAAILKEHVKVPVIGVGGIETGAFIDEILAEGRVDLAAVGRAILKDPRAWARKSLCSREYCNAAPAV